MRYNLTKLKKEVLENYKGDKYIPLGSDGGCLKYILTSCYLKNYSIRASVTTDTEISEILPIVSISLIDKNDKYINILDYTKEYYKCRV